MNHEAYLPHDWFPRPLPANVVLGARSWCYSSFAFLHYRSRQPCGVRVGHDSGIYHGTFFDLGPDGEVEIGNYATLVGAIISTNSRVVIGDYAFLAHEVVLADSFTAMPGAVETSRRPADVPSRSSAIVVGNNSWIGARAILLSGARIGDGAIVGAAAVVNFEVPPQAIVAGNPAKVVGWAKP
ncbi:MAG TPA: acyltransferase [Verrucomicrobiae bacterium]|nr:acyltransferase [Verrucomicrobiae bacterium]